MHGAILRFKASELDDDTKVHNFLKVSIHSKQNCDGTTSIEELLNYFDELHKIENAFLSSMQDKIIPPLVKLADGETEISPMYSTQTVHVGSKKYSELIQKLQNNKKLKFQGDLEIENTVGTLIQRCSPADGEDAQTKVYCSYGDSINLGQRFDFKSTSINRISKKSALLFVIHNTPYQELFHSILECNHPTVQFY